MKKGIITIIILLCFAAGLTAGIMAYADKPQELRTATAKYSKVEEKVETTGDIKGEYSTTYYSEIISPIGEYSLKVGEMVRENQALLAYDVEDLEKKLEQALLTAESTENSMNGQIAASNKNASLYNQAVADTNTYMGLYAIARQSNDQINQAQYQENWDIGESKKGIDTCIAERGVDISSLQIRQSEIKEEIAKDSEYITSIRNTISELDIDAENYEDQYDELMSQVYYYEEKNTRLSTDLQEIGTQILEKEKAVASGKVGLASLPQAALTPEEKQKTTANGNWMEDITRNWTQATTTKNTYENQILNSYQKEQLQNAYDLSELSVYYAQDDIDKALLGISSDYNGVVTESFIERGAVVTKGTPLFTIESSDDLKVLSGISKYDIGKIAVGQRAEIFVAGHSYEGFVSDIKRLAVVSDSDKAKVDVSIHINNPDEYAYLGLEADVTIFTNEVDNTLVIPMEGYYADDEGDYCYIIHEGQIVKKYINTGVISDEYVEVLSGIQDGDIVITDAVTDESIGHRAVSK